MAGPYLERLLPYDLVYGYQYNRIVDALTNNRTINSVAMLDAYDVCFGYQPVDATFKARCRFHVHTNIDTIIQVALHFTLQPFHVGNQTTSQTTTAAANTSGGTSHSHVLEAGIGTVAANAGFDVSGNFITATTPEGVSVGIEYIGGLTTSGQPPGPHSLGAHTHTIPSLTVNSANLNPPTAIYEAGMAQGVHVFIDGTDRTVALGGPWGVGVALDVTDLNLLPYITSTGWHEIQLSSTNIGGITTQVQFSGLLNGSIT